MIQWIKRLFAKEPEPVLIEGEKVPTIGFMYWRVPMHTAYGHVTLKGNPITLEQLKSDCPKEMYDDLMSKVSEDLEEFDIKDIFVSLQKTNSYWEHVHVTLSNIKKS